MDVVDRVLGGCYFGLMAYLDGAKHAFALSAATIVGVAAIR